MGRDLLTRPYGRFYYLPKVLSERGHEVYVALLDYRPQRSVVLRQGGVTWISVSVWYGVVGYVYRVNQLIEQVSPDWVGGFSDTYFGIIAQWVTARRGIACMIDAYDNYESYAPWLTPLHRLWRSAVAKADLVTAAGPNLAEYLGRERGGRPTQVVPMAPDPGFSPRDRQECRSRLGLPVDTKLVGYCGAVYPSRGMEVLFDAYEMLLRNLPDVRLVLSGRKHPRVTLHPKALWLGQLPDNDVPVLLNSFDVAVVMNQASAFGNYSYPVKLYEAMSCHIPVVASHTPATRWVLQEHRELLVEPDDGGQLCKRIEAVLSLERVDYGITPGWDGSGIAFEQALSRCARNNDHDGGIGR